MPPVSAVESFIYYVSSAAHLILLIRLYSTGLAKIYPWFVRFLAFQFVATVAALSIDPRTNLFGYVWIPAQVFLCISYYLVVYESFSLVLADYPGIQRWGERVMHVGIIVCLLIAAVSLLAELNSADKQYPILLAVNVCRRGILSALVLFIGMMMAYLTYFPVPLKKNVLAHAGLCGIYFLTLAAGVFFRNMAGPANARAVSTVLGAVTVIVVAGWIFLLNSAGERATRRPAWKWSSEDESLVLGHLQSINDSLLASSRK